MPNQFSKGQNSSKIRERLAPEVIVKIKKKILGLLDTGNFENLSQCADEIGISKLKVYEWLRNDAEWRELYEQTKQVIADKYEIELRDPDLKMPQVTAKIFRLNALRPEIYRQNYKVVITNPKVEEMINDLRKLGKDEKDAQPRTS